MSSLVKFIFSLCILLSFVAALIFWFDPLSSIYCGGQCTNIDGSGDGDNEVQFKKTIKIGVLSPMEGKLREIGHSHLELIKYGLNNHGKILHKKNVYDFELIVKNTFSEENDENCLEKAKELQDKEGVALIFGPVSSGCSSSVLSGDLNVPVVTTLASSTRLSIERNGGTSNGGTSNSSSVTANHCVSQSTNDGIKDWFFRANGIDRDRINKLWDYVDKRHLSDNWEDINLILLNDNTCYGSGLAEDFRSIMPTSKEQMLNKEDTSGEKCKSRSTVCIGKNELEQYIDKDEKKKNLIFIFGTNEYTEQILLEINELNSKVDINYEIYTVGDLASLTYFDSNLITVGEMKMEVNSSYELSLELDILKRYASNNDIHLYPTTYQVARFVAPEAIEVSLSRIIKDGGDLNINSLREEIIKTLAHEQFNSLFPPEHFKFVNGDMVVGGEFPIYKVVKSLVEVEPEQGAKWVELIESRQFDAFEEVVYVDVVGHGMEGETVDFYIAVDGQEHRLLDSRNDLVEGQVRRLNAELLFPGEYKIFSAWNNTYPNAVLVEVQFSKYYLVAIFLAILAVLLKHKISQQKRFWHYIELLFEGVVAGLLISVAANFIQLKVFDGISEYNAVNAAIYGFFGGWYGPALVHTVMGRPIPK